MSSPDGSFATATLWDGQQDLAEHCNLSLNAGHAAIDHRQSHLEMAAATDTDQSSATSPKTMLPLTTGSLSFQNDNS
jgi:hypothetical protein